MADIIKYFNEIVPLTELQVLELQSILQSVSINKGDVYLGYNEKSDKIAFIEEGLLEMTMNEDGNERIIDFLFPNSFATDYLNFLLNNPSEIQITAIKDSKLLCFEKDSLAELYEKDIYFQKIGRKIAEKYYIEFVQRLRALNLPAMERFKMIIKSNPNLFQQVPQYKVASFLNISAEWLSKLRAKK